LPFRLHIISKNIDHLKADVMPRSLIIGSDVP
jgi:hypothetical protein